MIELQNNNPQIHSQNFTPSQNSNSKVFREENPNEITEKKKNSFYSFTRKHLPMGGAYISALGHSISSIFQIFNLDKKESVDKASLLLSKIMVCANDLIQTIEANKDKRGWETIARILNPIMVLMENKVEDLGLARGLGIGISQIVESQDGIREKLIEENQIADNEMTTALDHKFNSIAFKKIFAELLRGGIGKNRRFMTGFTIKNIKKEFRNFKNSFKFSSIKHLFNFTEKDKRSRIQNFFDDSGLSHLKKLCIGDSNRDKGHTAGLGGYVLILGSLMGYVDKARRGFFYKLGGTLRNIGGTVISDVSIMGAPDPKHNMAAPWLFVNGALDTMQRFVPQTFTRTIKALGNLSMATYNIGSAIYLNRSSDKTNEKDKVERYDTDY